MTQYTKHTTEEGDHEIIMGSGDNHGCSNLGPAGGRVREFLSSQGVPDSRMVAVGYGSSRPVAPNDTDVNRALNRRVQLEISPNANLKAQGSGNN